MPTSVQSNAELGRRFFAEQDRLRGGPAPELCAPEYTALLNTNPPVDRAGHESLAKAFYAALPEARHVIEEAFATDDRVAVRLVFRGKQTGPLMGVAPAQKTIAITVHAILHVANGKVTRLVEVFDEAGLLRQLGVLPDN